MAYTADQKLKAVEREIAYRRRVFPRLIENGKMSRETAAVQIAIFEAIRADYETAQQKERLI